MFKTIPLIEWAFLFSNLSRTLMYRCKAWKWHKMIPTNNRVGIVLKSGKFIIKLLIYSSVSQGISIWNSSKWIQNTWWRKEETITHSQLQMYDKMTSGNICALPLIRLVRTKPESYLQVNIHCNLHFVKAFVKMAEKLLLFA